MPAKKQDKVLVVCPSCGHQQAEPRTAFSSVCKKCGQHLRVQEILNPAPKAAEQGPARKRITCFECGAELEVPVSAESTMCKRCSRYVDMKNYVINSAVSKNFKTKGSFVIEPKGYVFNTEAVVHEAVIKGRFLGKLFAEQSLTIYSTAEIKGSFKTGRLVVPAANHFRWAEPIQIRSAEIAGELAANLLAEKSVVLKSTARLFGDIEAADLIVEEGAVVVGRIRIGRKG
ncbi:MAG TPA: polymer-forming cytoskeletal protein [Candidatus Polarisedimenticolia bacterium]|nr:polymer-forming cytoskeletal protein [Candidatus Polarisedimenticolia bacterium]